MIKIKSTVLLIIFFVLSIIILPQNILNVSISKNSGENSESFRSFTFDGAWSGTANPSAIYFEGNYKRTYTGWVDSHGDIIIGYYDNDTHLINTIVLEDNFGKDDRNNPALLFTPDGKLMVFLTKKDKQNSILLYKMKNPEDISSWDKSEIMLNDKTFCEETEYSYAFVCPVILSGENNRIYLFRSGFDSKLSYSYSDDMGKSWSDGKVFISSEFNSNLCEPYMKVASKGKDKIMFVLTARHLENGSCLYYMSYKNGAFYNVEGQKIDKLDDGPVNLEKYSVNFDVTTPVENLTICDIAMDDNEKPVMVFTTISTDSTCVYSYTKWNGKKWITSELINPNKYFSRTSDGSNEYESSDLGEIVIDHEKTNEVYLSIKRDSVYEIEKWTNIDEAKWNSESITFGSSKDNIRPFAVRNARDGNPLQLLWMQSTKYNNPGDYLTSIKMNLLSPEIQDPFDIKSIKNIMRQTADWQLANPYTEESRIDWHWGAFYIGLEALYETTKEERYLNEMVNVGQEFNWKLIDDIFHADRLTIADVYAWLYEMKKDQAMIDKARWAMDIHMSRRAKADVSFYGNKYRFEWWTWCDALFMGPPSFARMYEATGDTSYLKYANEHWWKTSDYLYSNEDSLFFRDDRYFEKKTQNGKKIFWGRGNGWVIAGLARMLNIIPQSYPSRTRFENQFKEMAYKLLSLQREDGLWTASLYDPDELPLGESSGSSFFTYALAWGINNGLLDKKEFEPAVKKAWAALCKNVNEWGRLGYVQPIAGDPNPFYEYQWQVYATGAFLLCGNEIIKMQMP